MHVASTALLLLFITTLCAPLSRLIRLPPPLLQIALGAGASLLGMQARLEPDVFLLLFIPPLLFSDAFLMPMREFRQLHGVILGLAIGLVLFATLVCGVFVHWLIPVVPLAACFTLAAVLSPTDAIAVGGMLEGRNVPPRFLHVLTGEALLNDASGLVCFKFAAAAAMTGSFSVLHAAGGFVLMSLGGLAVGAVLAYLMALMERWLLGRGFDHAPAFVSLAALLPFAAYLCAEHIGTSGILAAVSAGLVTRQGRVYAMMRTETRLGATATWDVLTFAFNGMIFVLLGLQLPEIVQGGLALMHRVHLPVWRLPLTIVEITLVLIVLRLAWVHGTRLVRRLLSRGAAVAVSERLMLAMAVGGVRGAITLAAVLSLPIGFPARNALVTLATGVILCSLLLATIALPPLLAGVAMPSVDHVAVETDRARLAMARTASDQVAAEAEHADGEHRPVLNALLDEMRAKEQRLQLGLEEAPREERDGKISAKISAKLSALGRQRLETATRLRVLRAERDSLSAMTRAGTINDDIERLLVRELDHQEEVVLATARSLPRERASPRRTADKSENAA